MSDDQMTVQSCLGELRIIENSGVHILLSSQLSARGI